MLTWREHNTMTRTQRVVRLALIGYVPPSTFLGHDQFPAIFIDEVFG